MYSQRLATHQIVAMNLGLKKSNNFIKIGLFDKRFHGRPRSAASRAPDPSKRRIQALCVSGHQPEPEEPSLSPPLHFALCLCREPFRAFVCHAARLTPNANLRRSRAVCSLGVTNGSSCADGRKLFCCRNAAVWASTGARVQSCAQHVACVVLPGAARFGLGHKERISRSLTPPPLPTGAPEVHPGRLERRSCRDRPQRRPLILPVALQPGPVWACFRVHWLEHLTGPHSLISPSLTLILGAIVACCS